MGQDDPKRLPLCYKSPFPRLREGAAGVQTDGFAQLQLRFVDEIQ
jgi:hypothetical protein